jgi:hypothetical protein
MLQNQDKSSTKERQRSQDAASLPRRHTQVETRKAQTKTGSGHNGDERRGTLDV